MTSPPVRMAHEPGLLRRWISRLWTHEVEAGASSAYPDVRPLELPVGPSAAYAAALDTAKAMPRWRIVSHDAGKRRIEAEARTRLLRFVDDVEVWIVPMGGSWSRVRARSTSRVALTDFGTNARRLRVYLERVSQRALMNWPPQR
jgi:uncharacterized protein (DUF1499 family)